MSIDRQDKSQFHSSELEVQKRLGVEKLVAQYSEGFIRKAMPQQHRDFFCELPFVIFGLVDKQGYPWVIPLFNDTHEEKSKVFISSPNDITLKFEALPKLENLLELDFKPEQKVGMLGIQLESRRRNRMNGLIGEINGHSFTVNVEQSFGNCPKYIQTRELTWQNNIIAHEGYADVNIVNDIDQASKSLIEKSDTFFIASRTNTFSEDTRTGIDVSHRGGKPGFVKVDENTVYFPDFSGNQFFNTLGNIESDSRVGILFLDFSTGDSVFIVGKATVLWDSTERDKFDGAERIVKIFAEKIVYIPQFTTLRGELVEFSPALDSTGTWTAPAQSESSEYHPLEIIRKQNESDTITSFYLAPIESNNQLIKDYIPGQHLPIQISIPGDPHPTHRVYTLSRSPVSGSYRISVKREEDGIVSNALHDSFGVGDTLNVGSPSGKFILRKNDGAVVLISGGVGITPMIAILEGIINDVNNGAQPRPVWFIHGTKNTKTLAFKRYLRQLEREHSWLNTHIVYSRPQRPDSIGHDYHSQGHISIELLKQILPFDKYDFYLCGSEKFMREIYSGLQKTGVKKSSIFYEFFGKGSIEPINLDALKKPANRARIHFSKSGILSEWSEEEGNILDFAEKKGMSPMYGCRTGNCGACACKITSGEVTYATPTNFVPEEDEILICCAVPADGSSEVVIDI